MNIRKLFKTREKFSEDDFCERIKDIALAILEIEQKQIANEHLISLVGRIVLLDKFARVNDDEWTKKSFSGRYLEEKSLDQFASNGKHFDLIETKERGI